MGDELDAWLRSGSSSDDDGDADEAATAELVRSLETMLAESAPRQSTPSGAAAAVVAATDDMQGVGCGCAAAASHNNPVRDWREEWRCSTRPGLQISGDGCRRLCMPVAEAQRSRVVEIPGLLDPSEIEQIHALAGRCTDADPFWDA